jgi:Cu2+-exporting ATPase
VFTLGFGIGASVVTNNIAALAALANGLLPMRRVAELEAERRHILEMELQQSGLLRDVGTQGLPRDLATGLVRAEALAAPDNPNAPHPYRTGLAAD